MYNKIEIDNKQNFEETIDQEFTLNRIGKTEKTKVRYPCLVLDGNFEIDASMVNLIKTLTKPMVRVRRDENGEKYTEELEEGKGSQKIALYLDAEGEWKLLGLLNESGVTALIDLLFPEESLEDVTGLEGWLNEDMRLRGNSLLILREY